MQTERKGLKSQNHSCFPLMMSHRWRHTSRLSKQSSVTGGSNRLSHFVVDGCALEKRTHLIAVTHGFTASSEEA